MPDFTLTPRPALGSKRAVRSSGFCMTPQPEGHVVHVLARMDASDVAIHLAKLGNGMPTAIRPAGPGQWFIVGDEAKSHSQMAALLAAMKPHVGVDQSHGRVRFRVEGPMIECVLAKGTGMDLALPTFSVGHATTTLFGHIAAHVTRVGETAFELMVLRSYVECLWDDIADMGGLGSDVLPLN